VFVAVDAFTKDLAQIGIPTPASGARFQQPLTNMTVRSNVPGIITGDGLVGGNIEAWPNNYRPDNSAGVAGASAQVYDHGDDPVDPVNGYGCLQVHNGGATQTVFAVNQWRSGPKADLGIGNSTGKTRDWTFTGNAGSYTFKRLRVLVRPKS
jgi:sialate O-acetylesterase